LISTGAPPAGGAESAHPDPLVGFKGLISKGRGGEWRGPALRCYGPRMVNPAMVTTGIGVNGRTTAGRPEKLMPSPATVGGRGIKINYHIPPLFIHQASTTTV